MSGLILHWGENTPGKSDLSVFRGGARVFARLHGIPASRIVPIHVYDGRTPTTPAERAAQSFAAVEALPEDGSLEVLAIFSHGFLDRLGIGFSVRNVERLASLLATRARPDLVVFYYACSTAKGTAPGGDGGFADATRDALCRAGLTDCVVFGHDRSAHAYFCPFVVRFDGAGSSVGGFGGRWVVQPRTSGVHAATWKWRTFRWCMQTRRGRLANPRLWARLPILSDDGLDAELRRFCRQATGAEAPG